MFINYIIFAISVCFISWLFAIFANSLILKTSWYDKLSNLNFIHNTTLHKALGIDVIKWIIKNTFFKYFNQSIKIESRNTDLLELRNQMTQAEISHLIGFVFVMIIAIYKSINVSIFLGLVIMFFNVLMNLHPSLIQQQNKRRLDKLIKRQQRFTNV